MNSKKYMLLRRALENSAVVEYGKQVRIFPRHDPDSLNGIIRKMGNPFLWS